MKKFAVYDKDNNWLWDIHADSAEQALSVAQMSNPAAHHVELVSEAEAGPRGI